MIRPVQATVLAVLMLGVLAPAAWAQDAWWNYSWPYRRALTVVDVPQLKLEGDEVAVATIYTGGLALQDLRDLRVVTAGGDVVPHKVLIAGPGDRVRLAFAFKSPVTKYHVYFGNDKATKPAADLVIKRGVLLETWTNAGGGMANLQQVQKIFERATERLGCDFRTQIFLGYNPFGPQERICSLFTAYVVAREDGEYTFSTTSQDASFLLVDGKLVVDNGGSHPPQREAVKTGALKLTKGLHEIKVYHASGGGDPVVVAAWKEPSGKRLWTIPPEAFAPVRAAQAGLLERYGKSAQADFIPVHAGECFMANRYFQRYAFELLSSGAGTAKPTAKWDFGDGQSATGAKVEHVYLRNGLFKVTLTAQVGGETVTRTNTISVNRPWDQVTENKVDAVADHAKIVSGYDFVAADPRDVGEAIALFERGGNADAILKAGDALIKRDLAPPNVIRDAAPVYATALVKQAKDPARAVAALTKAAEMSRDPIVSAAMLTLAGQSALEAGDADKAQGIFEALIKKYSSLTTADAVRDGRIGLGDVWRSRGDYAKAVAAYEAARPARQGEAEKVAVRRGDLIRHVEDYIRTRKIEDAAEYLTTWEREFPADKLEGFMSLQRIKLCMIRKDTIGALAEAETLVRVNPSSNYAPELLMLAADVYRSQGKPDMARQTLERITKNYPESPLAADAAKRLNLTASKPATKPATQPAAKPATQPAKK